MVHQGISVVQFTVQEGNLCRKSACCRINNAFLYNSITIQIIKFTNFMPPKDYFFIKTYL